MIRVKRIFKSFNYAFRGLFKVLREEQSLRIQSLAGILVLLIGWYFKLQVWQWVALILIIGLVILMEIVNSAIERIADALKPRIDNYVKEIKDIMAAAVMLASILAIIIGLIIFIPYLG